MTVVVPKTKQREHDELVATIQAQLDRCTNGDERAEVYRSWGHSAAETRAFEAIEEKYQRRNQGEKYSHIDPNDPFWEEGQDNAGT